MSNAEKRTILLNTIFNFGSNLVSNFVSVYLFIYAKSIPLMCLYIIIRIGLFPVFFILGTKIVKKHAFTLTYTFGLSLITLSLVYALLGGKLFEMNPYFVLVCAAIVGSGEGFYYFSANTCNQIVSDVSTRAKFLSYNGALSTISSIFAPIFASFLLSAASSEMNGYKIMLVVIIVVFIAVIFIAQSINSRSKDENSSVINALKLTGDKQWKDHCVGVFIYGLRNSLELNTIGLLIYSAAGSGGLYSKLQALFSIITVISYYLCKYLLNAKYVSRTMKIGVLIKIVSTLLLIYIPNVFGAISYGVLNAFGNAFYDNSYNFISAQVIGRYSKEMTVRVVSRETYLSLGRCVGMGFILLCYKLLPGDLYLIVSTTALAFTPILVERIMVKYK